jgi:hypothetical protein
MTRAAPRPQRPTAGTPYGLLVATGLAALALGGAAFLLWGTQGGAFVLDLVASYCF